jgi:threonine dehydratase
VINALSPGQAKGVVMTSSGNFAQGFALAGRIMKVPVVVVMLDHTSP